MVEAYYTLDKRPQYIISDNNRILLITTNGLMARELEESIKSDNPNGDETLEPE